MFRCNWTEEKWLIFFWWINRIEWHVNSRFSWEQKTDLKETMTMSSYATASTANFAGLVRGKKKESKSCQFDWFSSWMSKKMKVNRTLPSKSEESIVNDRKYFDEQLSLLPISGSLDAFVSSFFHSILLQSIAWFSNKWSLLIACLMIMNIAKKFNKATSRHSIPRGIRLEELVQLHLHWQVSRLEESRFKRVLLCEYAQHSTSEKGKISDENRVSQYLPEDVCSYDHEIDWNGTNVFNSSDDWLADWSIGREIRLVVESIICPKRKTVNDDDVER